MKQRSVKGDIFQVKLNSAEVKYFQYIAVDAEQLSSQVIRAFKEVYDAGEPIDCDRIVQGEVDFYAHVFLKVGVKYGAWETVGHAAPPQSVDVLFRCSRDVGNTDIKISKRWYVWRMNGPEKDVGVLSPQYQDAELGVVVAYDSVAYRMIHGEYNFVYPSF